jgi:hypothetical protein
MRRALDEFVIEELKLQSFHRQLMDDPRYIADYTAFMDTFKMIAPE